MRTRRYEDRVEEIVAAVERSVARVEVERHAVVAGPQGNYRDDDVPVHLPYLDLRIVHLDAAEQPGAIGLKVDDQGGRRVAQGEGDDRSPDERLLTGCRYGKRQLVAQVGDAPHPLLRQGLADARFRVGLQALRRADQRQDGHHDQHSHRCIMPWVS